MAINLFLVDAFANAPFTGNPAGVCPLAEPADPEWMQSVAAEMNQAETAFLWPESGGYRLRWFTPTLEVDLCGHATLASAHVLFRHLGIQEETIGFHTHSGLLSASKVEGGIQLDFPAELVREAELPFLPVCLGRGVRRTGRNRMDWFVELSDESQVRSIQPDFAEIERLGMRGLIVTAEGSTPGCDYVSRFFAPQSGVPEDHVTGSAHCALAPYWSDRMGRAELVGYQASPRGGFVRTACDGDRVKLTGEARTFLVGTLP